MANFQTIGANFQQSGAKVRFYLVCFGVFSGKSETTRGENKDIFYFRGFRGAAFILFCGGGGGVHWMQVVQVVRLFVVQDLPEVGAGPLVVCSVPLSLPFVPLLLLLSRISPQICLISHFKGVFSGFCGGCVGLCCLRALRGLCGFCTRE